MTNGTSNFSKILHEICEEEGISLTPFADEWAYELSFRGMRRFLYGYQFELNSAVTLSICNDKGMTSELLSAHDIPSVPHQYLLPPDKAFYTDRDGSFRIAEDLLAKYGTLVCQDNEGTGGQDVYLVRNERDLEKAVTAIFAKGCALSISPYIPVDAEYRAIVLDRQVELVFEKMRERLLGDGVSTVQELYRQTLDMPVSSTKEISGADLLKIPKKGEPYYLEWRHNLKLGAKARPCTGEKVAEPVKKLALKAADCLHARFVSVDVVRSGSEYQVLEVNAGVMMENFAGMNPAYYQEAKRIYKKAVLLMFEDGEDGQSRAHS